MKKSILNLAVLAAVCPAAAFAADADVIKTLVWNANSNPDLTNLTLNYSGEQLKKATTESYFDVVDIHGAKGRKDNVSLVVNAKGSANGSIDKQVIVLDIDKNGSSQL